MEDRILILSSWLRSERPLLEFSEAIAEFFVREANWRSPLDSTRKIEPYLLKSTWAANAAPHEEELLDIYDRQKALRQIRERDVVAIRLGFPGFWRDPYVIDRPVYMNWGVDIKTALDRVPSLFNVQILMHYSALWFPPQEDAEILYEKHQFVQEYQRAGYRLLVGKPSPDDGNSFLAEDALSQENRRKVILGVAQYIKRFSPQAASLSYYESAQYSWQNKTITYPKKMSYPPLMCYLGPGASISPNSLQGFATSFFDKEVEGVEMHLEVKYFGFFKE